MLKSAKDKHHDTQYDKCHSCCGRYFFSLECIHCSEHKYTTEEAQYKQTDWAICHFALAQLGGFLCNGCPNSGESYCSTNKEGTKKVAQPDKEEVEKVGRSVLPLKYKIANCPCVELEAAAYNSKQSEAEQKSPCEFIWAGEKDSTGKSNEDARCKGVLEGDKEGFYSGSRKSSG